MTLASAADYMVPTPIVGAGPDPARPALPPPAAGTPRRLLDHEAHAAVRHPLEGTTWRAWIDPEFVLNDFALQLEELDDPVARQPWPRPPEQ